MSVQVNDTPAPAAQQVGYKVFVGNLSFDTTDADLSEAFGKSGAITQAQVINRGSRSLGYGFVTFTHEAEALAAITALDKSEISGRPVNVELSKPAATLRAARPAQAPRAPRVAAVVEAPQVGEDGEVIVKKSKNKSSKARKAAALARQPRTDGETEEVGDAPVESAPAPRAPRAPRAPKVPGAVPVKRGPPTGEASKTSLFVANLPFSVDDDKLAACFAGLNLVSARVVIKKFGVGAGKSKGFGFVIFASEEDQKKALETVQGHEIEERKLELKIAIDAAVQPEEPEALVVAS